MLQDRRKTTRVLPTTEPKYQQNPPTGSTESSTMNILITNADGPDSKGLESLIDATRAYYREARITVIVPEGLSEGASMSSTAFDLPKYHPDNLQEVPGQKNIFTAPNLTPADIVDVAFHHPDFFIAKGAWDLVLSGINGQLTVGFDILRSATAGAAMTAATGYGCAAIAIHTESQGQLPRPSELILYDIMRTIKPGAGECWNINIPEQAAKGYTNVPTSHRSLHRAAPTHIVPRAANEKTDLTEVVLGYVTISRIILRTNEMLRY